MQRRCPINAHGYTWGIHTPERHAVDVIYGVTTPSAGVKKRWMEGRGKRKKKKWCS